MGEILTMWNIVLLIAEFAYNNSVNRSTVLSPFKIVIGYKPRKLMDLLSFPIGDRPNASSESFAQHLHDSGDDIHRQIAVSNDNFQSVVDLHKRLQKFAVGDEMMVKVRSERSLQEL